MESDQLDDPKKESITYVDLVVVESLAEIVSDHGLTDLIHLHEILDVLVHHRLVGRSQLVGRMGGMDLQRIPSKPARVSSRQETQETQDW